MTLRLHISTRFVHACHFMPVLEPVRAVSEVERQETWKYLVKDVEVKKAPRTAGLCFSPTFPRSQGLAAETSAIGGSGER